MLKLQILLLKSVFPFSKKKKKKNVFADPMYIFSENDSKTVEKETTTYESIKSFI